MATELPSHCQASMIVPATAAKTAATAPMDQVDPNPCAIAALSKSTVKSLGEPPHACFNRSALRPSPQCRPNPVRS
jgi:hypothetical protein